MIDLSTVLPVFSVITIVFCMLFGTGIALFFWIFLRPWSLRHFLTFAAYYQDHVIRLLVFISETFIKNDIVLYGDELPKGKSALVMPNHITHDWVGMYSLTYRIGMCGYIRGMVKRIIQYVPGFGWSMWVFYWPFLSRSWDKDRVYLKEFFGLLHREKFPVNLWLFAEGTRITKKHLQESQALAKERNYTVLQHCLLPRYRGFLTTVETLRDTVEYLYDVTLAYEGFGTDNPSFLQLITPTGSRRRIHIHVRCIPLSTLPVEEEALKHWLLEMFERKDVILSHFYKHGVMTGKTLPVVPLNVADFYVTFFWWAFALCGSLWCLCKCVF